MDWETSSLDSSCLRTSFTDVSFGASEYLTVIAAAFAADGVVEGVGGYASIFR